MASHHLNQCWLIDNWSMRNKIMIFFYFNQNTIIFIHKDTFANIICIMAGALFRLDALTHWGWVMHMSLSKSNTIDSYSGLSPGRCQSIIWTNVGILLVWPLGTNFSEMLLEIQTFPFMKMHLKMLSVKWRQFYLGLNVLTDLPYLPAFSSSACSSREDVTFPTCRR